jgi:hypothetical protein
MNLSPLEILEDDCETKHGFNIRIVNDAHVDMLIHRYVKIDDEFIEATKELLTSNIGNVMTFRSPMTCSTRGFKICKKCFGNYPVTDKKFVGIHCGQVVAERLTQLSMRSSRE